MSREWKPGDVAARTGADGSTAISLVTHADRSRIYCWGDHGDEAHWHHSSGGWNVLDDPPEFGSYRPLVVIDPEDREAVEGLARAYVRTFSTCDPIAPGTVQICATQMQAALREFADPKPPKPDEPQGLGAVVEDAEGRRWVRVAIAHANVDHCWAEGTASTGDRSYSHIDVVKVLSEGVQP